MKIGICATNPAMIKTAYESGLDFVEVSNWELAKSDEAAFKNMLALKSTLPEGFDFDEAMEQLVRVTQIFAQVAKKHGQRVCIEPLRTAECNIINYAEDAARLAEMTGCDNVGSHVDYYHLMQNGEKMSKLETLAKNIFHTHVASPCKRTLPTPDDGADYGQFIDCLRKGGYDATVSFEGGGEKTPESLKSFCDFMRSI